MNATAKNSMQSDVLAAWDLMVLRFHERVARNYDAVSCCATDEDILRFVHACRTASIEPFALPLTVACGGAK